MHIKSTTLVLLCSAALLVTTSAVQAESPVCKGMEQASCTASDSCRWVDAYKRSDGREVSGYCRKLPAKAVKDVSGTTEAKGTRPQKS